MWPERGESLDRTVAAEAAVGDLFAEGLRRWLPAARGAVLPSLTASGGVVLPPDPDGVGSVVDAWGVVAEEVILSGLRLLWVVAYLEAAEALGVDLPDPVEDPVTSVDVGAAAGSRPDPVLDKTVVGLVAGAAGLKPSQVRGGFARVDGIVSAREAADEYIALRREAVAAIPGLVRDALAAHIDSLSVDVTTTAVELDPEQLRAETESVLDAAGPEMRDLARREGYQAAGVMNHAVLAAAEGSSEDLHKTWICTLDAKTRTSHFVADGSRVPLKGTFRVGSDQLRFPGDPLGSPAEIKNCRCRVGVLAKDEQIPDEVDRHTERLDGRDSVVVNRGGRTQQEEIERRAAEGIVRARDDPDGVGRVASAGWAVSEEMDTMADETGGAETFLTFTDALFAVTGTPTSDGRMLAADIDLVFRDCPMPLQWCEKMEGGHFGSVTVGVIEAIRLVDGEVRADGYMLNNDNAAKAIDLVAHGVCNPSIDFMAEIVPTYADGTVVDEDNYDPDQQIFETAVRGEVMAATIVAIPAFGQTRIGLNAEREPRESALVASAVAEFTPRVYDPNLFADPRLSGPTHLQITDEGRIVGHVACWSERHRSVGLGHISPPRSKSDYANFHTSPPVKLSDGTLLPVGRLTVGIGHAPTTGVSNAAAQVHYDNPEACFALVRAGEDEHGIWVSGVAAPWASAEKVEMGLSSPMSGDWRPYGGDLDLVAVLAVNTPGFVCRGSGSGAGLALVASLGPSRIGSGGLTVEDVKAAVAEVLDERAAAEQFAARRSTVLARARETVGAPPTRAERVAALLDRV